MEIYVVKQGDTLYKIAQKYNTTVDYIAETNELDKDLPLVVGQTIVIVNDRPSTYTVQANDTLYKIALKFGVPLTELSKANPNITNPLNLQVGTIINIPNQNENKREIEVNGYCFVNISDEVLDKTLPYLTYLSIFSYEILADGNIVNIAGDTRLIDKARTSNVAPMMVITNIENNATFSSELAHQLLTNELAQANLIRNVVAKMQEKNYYGVDVDFEYLYPEDRELYNQFLSR